MAIGKKIAQQTGDERETAFLFQRLSVLVQRFNCVLLHDSLTFLLTMTAQIKCHSLHFQILIFVYKSLGILDTEGINSSSNNNDNNNNNKIYIGK